MLEKECTDRCRISVMEAEYYDEAWEDWFNNGHKTESGTGSFCPGDLTGF